MTRRDIDKDFFSRRDELLKQQGWMRPREDVDYIDHGSVGLLQATMLVVVAPMLVLACIVVACLRWL